MSSNLLIFSFDILYGEEVFPTKKKNQDLFKMESSAQLQGKGLLRLVSPPEASTARGLRRGPGVGAVSLSLTLRACWPPRGNASRLNPAPFPARPPRLQQQFRFSEL